MEGFQVILHYHHEAIKGLCTAYNRSEDVNSAQWRSEVLGTLSICLQEVIHSCDTFPADIKIFQVEKLVSITTVDRATGDLQLKLKLKPLHVFPRRSYKTPEWCLQNVPLPYLRLLSAHRRSETLGSYYRPLMSTSTMELPNFRMTTAKDAVRV
ncbi:hypothetical protein OS493_018485 [Desmophyllum pertusum]|uniref:Uncharacterized protein n=1 Tax=Desmophyllum pertusum TaxID=174260 RepID=A0A9X0DB02_9CNID|nr:hypothetical protein OS493_018485 [Desmophyllum pertusum]